MKPIIHGHASRINGRSPTYRVWHSMVGRCINPNRNNWKHYGGRGITVCPEWRKFENFLSDMGIRPDGLTLERKDNNLGYCKDNCVWATYEHQQNNKSNNRRITHRGESLTIAQWSKKLGFKGRFSVGQRIDALGWTEEQAVTIPFGGSPNQS